MILNKNKFHLHELAITGIKSDLKENFLNNILKILKTDYKVYLASEIETEYLIDQKLKAIDYDFTLIDSDLGFESNDKNIVFIENINPDLHNKNILAYITLTKSISPFINGTACFHHEDLAQISQFIINHFLDEAKRIPLNALILTGGKSSRMGQDKSQIKYHNQSQVKYLTDLLRQKCQQVFISCRADQAHDLETQVIYDNFLNIGPAGGILSYFQEYPLTRVLVIACDMPFINLDSVQNLISKIDPFKMATAYENFDKKWPEPLFTIYHPKSQARFFQLLAAGHTCPMKLLFNSTIKKITTDNKLLLLNGNTPEEMQNYKSLLMDQFNE